MKISFKSQFFRIHAPTLLWAVLILSVSSIPHLRSPDLGFSLQDKIAHTLVYCVLGFLLSRSCSAAGVRLWGWIAILLGLVYGAADEWHQKFIPGREPAFWDWAADAAGVILGSVLYRRIRARGRSPVP